MEAIKHNEEVKMTMKWFESKVNGITKRITIAENQGKDLSIKTSQLSRAKNNIKMYKRSLHAINIEKISKRIYE